METPASPGLASAWAALSGDPALLARVTRHEDTGVLAARLPVRELAAACAGACALAAAELVSVRDGGAVPAVRLDDRAVAAAFASERLLRVEGRAPESFAPLSRFWRTADGWVRTHANYPHHEARLLKALGLGAGAGPEEVAAVLRRRAARETEEAVYAAGGLAVALRAPEEWRAGPQARVLEALPLVSAGRIDAAPRRVFRARGGRLPLAGIRVLDLTRVLAGPVATRALALLGADVLRVDPPGMPELADQQADTGLGKRSALLDLADCAGLRRFEELLAEADVVVTGYRPGALERFGLTPDGLAARRPGLVLAQVSAWGRSGPWGQRRGFDSLVQVATGIAAVEANREGRPGALPAQALDHGTGYLLAAGVLRALTEQTRTGGSRLVRLALARTAAWLLDGPRAPLPAAVPPPPEEHTAERDSAWGRLRYALPAFSYEGGPADWARASVPSGTDGAEWG
ncbi:CoA transferase [Streptomyces sp. DSM 41982]|uniref:CoA transferase n=1 Tax=Streptomyces evansiae TaxID=3075535 RepID=A0ABD5ED85_9ACTN|nr:MULTISPECIES: CoA transferase [unclassified Streptomyces]MDT0418618.1 CoA transferase [Streptomyces sp. DSM 41982]SCD55161.1 CoA-transferase family III [Streptomyces sp. SolWspMP-sol7th]